jgi:polysaccharide export outer membrane protein
MKGPSLSKALLVAGLVVAVLFAGGCRSARIDEKTVQQANVVPPIDTSTTLPAAPVIGSIDYRVGPRDVLEVEVFGVEELTRTLRVSEGGEISMPLVGRLKAAGLTVADLEDEIEARLSDRYMVDPQVTVFVSEYMSQRVTVEGAVEKPGIYSLTGRTSLLQVIAMSEGLDPQLANPGGVVIYRYMEGRRYAAAFDIREIRAGRMVDPEVLGDDIVVVDYSAARSNLRDFLIALPALALFVAVI